ncbi:MFS transporter [Paenibacillus sp. NEAU-GSW1]|uniref:MFS transporter n=1 Tax=Paenibacillus sp. NEAU-GSW1 TaxID=2682486 RepID=UPI0012E28550|nr:MFS transporter [Paenibacillus sp. NEAU-GSW1]MUT66976.1 MFS transporter [Paenibacillus sp. NEAU-GSW1]
MNRLMVYTIALGVFLTATAELVVSGIVDIIAKDLQVSLAAAGQLVTVFSLAFAIGTPIVISLAGRINRKKMLLGSLVAFALGSLLAFMSTDLLPLLISRLLLGVSAGVYLVVALGSAAKLVQPAQLGGAIATMILGFSAAMILGVPIGIFVAERLDWHTIFAILGFLAIVIGAIIYKLVPDMEGDAPISYMKQFKVLGGTLIISGLLLSFFKEAGNTVLLTYMIPYMKEVLNINTSIVTAVMFGLGLVGAVGSRLGGFAVDRWGAARTVVITIATLFMSFALLPLAAPSSALRLLLIALIILAMFASGPAVQSYFIQSSPASSNLVLSLNTSIIHLGLASGAGAGGLLIETSSTFVYHPWMGAAFLLLGLSFALFAFRASRREKNKIVKTATSNQELGRG